MIFKCARCLDDIAKPGGLVFSPPDASSRSIKTHLCESCYFDLTRWILAGRDADAHRGLAVLAWEKHCDQVFYEASMATAATEER